jgi:alpha-1,2-glucosyltransferase
MKFINNRLRIQTLLAFAAVATVHIGAFVLIRNHGLFIDEGYHFRQITSFLGGNFKPDPMLSMIPGYHWTIVVIAKIIHVSRFEDIRLISFILNLLTIPIFYLAARKIDPKTALIRCVQYSFFPLIFPYFSMIYTDTFSLLFILTTVWLIYIKRYRWAGLVISLSILARQNNIFWLLFFFLFIYVKKYGRQISGNRLVKHLTQTWGFFIGIILFLEFYIINKGITVGDRAVMYLNFANQGNTFTIPGLFILLFLPLIFPYGKDVLQWWRKNIKKSIFIIPAFLIYWRFFTNTHPYNQSGYFLHNILAIKVTYDAPHKIFFSLLILAALSLISRIRLKDKASYLIYPFTIVYLLPIWFLEWRYYVVPYILFLLFREPKGWKTELALTVYFLVISVYFYQGTIRGAFFL